MRCGLFVLFASGLASGWSAVTRMHNLPITFLLLVLALLATWSQAQGDRRRFVQTAGVFLAGLAITLSVWLIYNQAVFARPLATGYAYKSPYQGLFLWEDNPFTDIKGRQLWHVQPTAGVVFSTLIKHLGMWFEPLMRGWPLLPLAFAALVIAAVQKRLSAVHWLSLSWLIATSALYAGIVYFGITYELTIPYFRGEGFYGVDRYLFPASMPIALLTALFLARLRSDLQMALLIVFVGASLISFGRFVL